MYGTVYLELHNKMNTLYNQMLFETYDGSLLRRVTKHAEIDLRHGMWVLW
jgi:hypothetical protein